MNSTWELKEKSTGTLKTTVGGDNWAKAQEKAFNKLAEGIEIKGFRKGQAPEKLVRKQIGTQQILMEAVEHVANDALPIGGLREKSIAAQRSGITTIVIPKENEKDLEDVPAYVKERMDFIPVEKVTQVLDVALVKE